MVVDNLFGVGGYDKGVASVEFPVIPYEAVKPCDSIRGYSYGLPMPLNVQPWFLRELHEVREDSLSPLEYLCIQRR